MKFHIPFTLGNIELLKRKSKFFSSLIKYQKITKLQSYLNNAGQNITEKDYIAICLRSYTIFFVIIYLISTTLLVLIRTRLPFLLAIGLAFIFSTFVFFSQIIYPKVYDSKRVKNIERNLIPALQDMLVQLNSGIPLFNILVNISSSNYGELSEEFKKAVKKINSGFPQVDVLEEIGERNPSIYFKRTLWQLSNGMRAGSDITIVVQESIKTLNEEQLLQIQNYGNKLNPLIMFYMVITVIIPALSIVFLTIISSLINLAQTIVSLLFVGFLIFAILLQIMFIGIIKSIRPSLL